MTLDELSKKLNEMYFTAPKGGKVTMSILFGIKYYDHIKIVGVTSIIKQSGLPIKYNSEVSKGVNLASYVTLIKSEKTLFLENFNEKHTHKNFSH